MSKLRETEDLLEAVQTEKGNSEAQVTNVQHESTTEIKCSMDIRTERGWIEEHSISFQSPLA